MAHHSCELPQVQIGETATSKARVSNRHADLAAQQYRHLFLTKENEAEHHSPWKGGARPLLYPSTSYSSSTHTPLLSLRLLSSTSNEPSLPRTSL